MDYPKTKVYFDGSHYIGIPHTTQPWKKNKNKSKEKNIHGEKVKEIYKESKGTKKEKIENTINKVNEEIKDIEKSTQIVNETLEKDKRNKVVRYTRLIRKVRLQQWTHFCTFTYSEELAQKVSRGLHESRMKGHCIGSVPYGHIKENKKLIINEEQALILNRIYEDYSNGYTILQISRKFAEENITNNGKLFMPETIRHFLQRKTYTGEYEINGKQYLILQIKLMI